jgi:hypothetical protein
VSIRFKVWFPEYALCESRKTNHMPPRVFISVREALANFSLQLTRPGFDPAAELPAASPARRRHTGCKSRFAGQRTCAATGAPRRLRHAEPAAQLSGETLGGRSNYRLRRRVGDAIPYIECLRFIVVGLRGRGLLLLVTRARNAVQRHQSRRGAAPSAEPTGIDGNAGCNFSQRYRPV